MAVKGHHGYGITKFNVLYMFSFSGMRLRMRLESTVNEVGEKAERKETQARWSLPVVDGWRI
jgi:hypothetical protein